LIRKIIEHSKADLQADFGGQTLAQALLAPTQIYVKPLLTLFEKIQVHALAHITGGGLLENIPRVMPANTRAHIHKSAWQMPSVFNWLQQQGRVAQTEMYRTFNCGIGMTLILAKQDQQVAMQILQDQGLAPVVLGSIEFHDGDPLVTID
jgi:phosphoribosylformylglycinamidine cyclo-ligase